MLCYRYQFPRQMGPTIRARHTEHHTGNSGANQSANFMNKNLKVSAIENKAISSDQFTFVWDCRKVSLKNSTIWDSLPPPI